ncbi:MAG: leucine-rich repeat protein, partial [Clostridia bacterium]|nr:leucine-rich repeat protein [Clostridia bacterium]
MKQTKKLLGIILALMMILGAASLTSVTAAAVEGLFIDGDMLTGCMASGDVVLPDEVTRVGDMATGQSDFGLTSIIMPNVTSMGTEAFSGSASLKYAAMPKVTYMDEYAFDYCSSLTSILLSSDVNFSQASLNHCNNLKTIYYTPESDVEVLKTKMRNLDGVNVDNLSFIKHEHSYANGTCTGCGLKEEKSYTWKDMLDAFDSYGSYTNDNAVNFKIEYAKNSTTLISLLFNNSGYIAVDVKDKLVEIGPNKYKATITAGGYTTTYTFTLNDNGKIEQVEITGMPKAERNGTYEFQFKRILWKDLMDLVGEGKYMGDNSIEFSLTRTSPTSKVYVDFDNSSYTGIFPNTMLDYLGDNVYKGTIFDSDGDETYYTFTFNDNNVIEKVVVSGMEGKYTKYNGTYTLCNDAELRAEAAAKLDAALAEAKSDKAKEALNNAKSAIQNCDVSNIDSIVNKALADALAFEKEAAVAELEAAKANYTSDDAKQILDEAIASVNNAADFEAVDSAKHMGLLDAGSAEERLDSEKEHCKSQLEAEKANCKSDEAKQILENAKGAVDNATSIENVTYAMHDGMQKAAMADQALEQAQNDAIEELEAAKDNYTLDEAKAAIDNAIAEVEKATSIDAVNQAKEKGIADAAEADKALAKAKDDAKAELEAAKANYTSDDAKAILDTAIASIDSQTDIDAINNIKNAAISDAMSADDSLATAKDEAKKALEDAKANYKSDAAKKALEDGKKDVDNATTQNLVSGAVTKAKGLADQADNDLDMAKQGAKNEIDTIIRTNQVESDAAKEALENAKKDIDNATSIEEVNAIKEKAYTDAEGADADLDSAKAKAIDDLETKKADVTSDEAKDALDDAIEAVKNATSPNAVDWVVEDGLGKASSADKALEKAKDEAKKALEDEKANATSDEAKKALDDAKSAIDNATNLPAVADAKQAGLDNADAADEALAQAKEDAKKALDDAKADYISADAKNALDEAKTAVDNATSIDDVNNAKDEALKNAKAAEDALNAEKDAAKADLDEALANAKSKDAKEALTNAKNGMDYLPSSEAVDEVKQDALNRAKEADEALKEVADAAIAELDERLANATSGEARTNINNAKAEIANAETAEDIARIKQEALDKADDDDKMLAEAKEACQKALDEALADAKSDEAKEILENAKEAVDNGEFYVPTVNGAYEAIEAAKAADEALAQAKEDAKKALE